MTQQHAVPPRSRAGDRKIRDRLCRIDKMEKTIVVELEDRVKHPSTARSSVVPPRSRHMTRRRRRSRRSRSAHGDPPAVRHEALATGRGPRKGQVSNSLRQCPLPFWGRALSCSRQVFVQRLSRALASEQPAERTADASLFTTAGAADNPARRLLGTVAPRRSLGRRTRA